MIFDAHLPPTTHFDDPHKTDTSVTLSLEHPSRTASGKPFQLKEQSEYQWCVFDLKLVTGNPKVGISVGHSAC